MKMLWGKTRVGVTPLLPRLPGRESSGGQTPSTTQEVAERGASEPLADGDRFTLDSAGLCWSSVTAAPGSRINLEPNPSSSPSPLSRRWLLLPCGFLLRDSATAAMAGQSLGSRRGFSAALHPAAGDTEQKPALESQRAQGQLRHALCDSAAAVGAGLSS